MDFHTGPQRPLRVRPRRARGRGGARLRFVVPAAVLAATLGLPAGSAWADTDPPPAAVGGDEPGLHGAPGRPDGAGQPDGSGEADVTGAGHDGAGDDRPPEDGSTSHEWTWARMDEMDQAPGRMPPRGQAPESDALPGRDGPSEEQAQPFAQHEQPPEPQTLPAEPGAPEPVVQQPSQPMSQEPQMPQSRPENETQHAQPQSRPVQQDSPAAVEDQPTDHQDADHRPPAEGPAEVPAAGVEPPREPERRPSARPKSPREHERRPAAKPRTPRKHDRPSTRPKSPRAAVQNGGTTSAATGAEAPAKAGTGQAKPKTGVLRSAARQVVRLINAKRTAAGCRPLRVSRKLSQAAKGHADDMAKTGKLSHTAPDGSRPSTRAARAGYGGWSAIGENIARGQRSPAQVTQDWMNSPGHRANILNCGYKEIGVGVRESESGGRWWSQSFGARRR
ncbi:CAP domain-containing protein [Streptomyces sp. NPDC047108]|uniref:CAP domain-containing protein n=1 Tax=Streptomyces sp. NPDC047108 TaxID=3155025 RepID=UPI003408625D